MAQLENKIAIITGSATGMGEGIARMFVSEGARVVIADRDEVNGSIVTNSILKQGGDAIFCQTDIRREQECRAVIDKTIETYGRLDILVNNAGITTRGNVENTSVEIWDDVFLTNVRGAFICTQQAVRYLKLQSSGSIINIGSVNAYIGDSKLLAYSASKGALMTFTRNVANFLKQYRIRVNLINVGWTLTPTEHQTMLLEGAGDDWLEEAVRTRPFGRMLLPADVGYAALYFASDVSECVTGTVMDLEQYPVGAPCES